MKLRNVIIADDEAIIREGIREAINWEALGLQVVAEAEDGEEAYELAVKHQADIVLVDLNMPIMDGFTLMNKLRERFEQIRFIVITGYDEFEYVRTSLRLGVDDYILKPANPEQLQQVLEKTRRQLEEDEARAEYLRLASKQIEKNASLLRERFCLDWIDGNVPESELEEQLRFLKLPPRMPEHLGMLRWPDLSGHQSVWSERDRQLLSYAVENIVNEKLEGKTRVLFRTPAGVLVFLVWEEVPENWAAETERTISSLLKISVRIHVVRVAEASAQTDLSDSVSKVIENNKEEIEEHTESHESNESHENHKENESNKSHESNGGNRGKESNKNNKSNDSNENNERNESNGNNMSNKSKESNEGNEGNKSNVSKASNESEDPDASPSGQCGIVARAYARCKKELYGEAQLSPLVRRARQYIREHYHDPELTLERLAAELNVSAVYLSRVIRQELDMSYIQLLTQTRLEKAAQLLHASDLSIAEIAERVGYESQHYFSAVFKKGTGVSPNQYRRQQQENKAKKM